MPRYLVNVDNKEFDIELEYKSEKYIANINGEEVEIESHLLGENRSIMLIDGKSLEVDVRSNGYDSTRTVFILGQEVPVTIENYNLAQLKKTAGMSSEKTMDKLLKAPMPGLVLEVKVSAGSAVKKGDSLLIIEAMKMENVIKATGDGLIKEISVEAGQSVEKDDRLMEFE
jgi:biotin carboxyl carrier protein